jgi:hypothetical protein
VRRIFCHALMILITGRLAFGQTPSSLQKTYVLDFVTAPSETDTPEDRIRQREAGVGRLGRHFQPDWERLPLELTLLELDRPGYTVGDRVVYEVAIKHVGTKPFPFPVTHTTGPFSRTNPVTRQVAILLHFHDEALGDQLIGVESTAYGGDSLPQTFVMLNPGDIVRVRAVGNWFLQGATNSGPPTSWVRNVTVKAQLQYYGAGPLNPIDDSNGIKIQLQSRR